MDTTTDINAAEVIGAGFIGGEIVAATRRPQGHSDTPRLSFRMPSRAAHAVVGASALEIARGREHMGSGVGVSTVPAHPQYATAGALVGTIDPLGGIADAFGTTNPRSGPPWSPPV